MTFNTVYFRKNRSSKVHAAYEKNKSFKLSSPEKSNLLIKEKLDET